MNSLFLPSSQLPFEKISDTISRRFVSGEKLTLCHYKIKKGGKVALHHHPSEQISVVISGVYQITVQGHAYLLKSGDILLVSSNIPHEGEAIEDVVFFESFSPQRKDWQK